MVTYPTVYDLDLMTAYLGGYIEQGNLVSMPLTKAVEIAGQVAPGVTIDGQIASRILRRCGFNRSYLPADAGDIIYRRKLP
ncbi:hypothetical protein [Sphingomonas sp. GV3]|uniref:hypothetical protein n=1 Tax=Sphingomonas sp. GV3 TaxID=3040671 RepID=UPI00280B7718|nr:hypothetical protein [Sphingomonas sp. GV3]